MMGLMLEHFAKTKIQMTVEEKRILPVEKCTARMPHVDTYYSKQMLTKTI